MEFLERWVLHQVPSCYSHEGPSNNLYTLEFGVGPEFLVLSVKFRGLLREISNSSWRSLLDYRFFELLTVLNTNTVTIFQFPFQSHSILSSLEELNAKTLLFSYKGAGNDFDFPTIYRNYRSETYCKILFHGSLTYLKVLQLY